MKDSHDFGPNFSNQFSIWLFSVVALILSACGPNRFVQDVLPQQKATCGGSIISNQYIVKYFDGRIVTYTFDDIEDFKKEVVVPQLNTINYIEYNQTFTVEPLQKSPQQKLGGELGGSFDKLDNYALRLIRAESAWQRGFLGQGVKVAVVDSGIDVNHPQLFNQIAYNSGEIGFDSQGRDKRFNGLDDDDNGFVDDYAGYDFVGNTGFMSDDLSHGTHVSGIVAAEHSSTTVVDDVVQGLAPAAKILPVRFLSRSGGGTLDGALKSIDYSRQMGAKIINASWGGGCSQALQDKIQQVTASGIIFVTAAGNSGKNLEFSAEYPAVYRFPLQLTVGSTGQRDGMSSFSNYSRIFVDLFAPGFNIPSTLPHNMLGPQSGTSMATPFVAAAAATLYSAKPNAQPEQVVRALMNSVDKNSTYMNRSGGRLNVARAIDLILAR